jgi:hypothetical protein
MAEPLAGGPVGRSALELAAMVRAGQASALQPSRRHPQPLGPGPHARRVQRRRRRRGRHRHGPAGAGQRPGRLAARARPCQRRGRAAANPRTPPLHGCAGRSPSMTQQLFAVPGPVGRDVADPHATLAVLAGPHPADRWSVPVPLEDPAFPPARRRVAVTLDPSGGAPIVAQGYVAPPRRWTGPAGRSSRPNRPTSVPPPRCGCGRWARRSPPPERSWSSWPGRTPAPSYATCWPSAHPGPRRAGRRVRPPHRDRSPLGRSPAASASCPRWPPPVTSKPPTLPSPLDPNPDSWPASPP